MTNIIEHLAVASSVTSSRAPASDSYSPPPLRTTPHPPWLKAMLHSLQDVWNAACWPSLFKKTIVHIE